MFFLVALGLIFFVFKYAPNHKMLNNNVASKFADFLIIELERVKMSNKNYKKNSKLHVLFTKTLKYKNG